MKLANPTSCGSKLALLLILEAVLYFAFVFKDHGELGQKRGWMVLQQAELKYRKAQTHEPILIPNAYSTEFTILGLPTPKNEYTTNYVWTILVNDDPYVAPRLMPMAKYEVQCKYVEELARKYNITDEHPNAVITLLRLTCLK